MNTDDKKLDDVLTKIISVVIGTPIVLIFGIMVYLVIIPLTSLLFAWPIMYTWNMTMPYLFNLPELTFWKAYALDLVICWLGLRKLK